ncbi:MAG: 23S rRNA (adenine(2503)-C(2))-methyltransferase RlmN [Deltaproteobacteria bacterium]|nr:23S rRNA (adenine(2503)-C(2))-methyltransferase RlmN [Deltaproteobacteria bacterium]
MQNILDLTLKDIEKHLLAAGEKPFHARQIIAWIYSRGITSFDEMTDISKGLREKVKNEFYISIPEIAATEVSFDGTRKVLLKLHDGNFIECVLIPEEKRLTLCVSTQVGCSLTCRFCLTGKMGFTRNLKVSEMSKQVFACKSLLADGQKITNVVLMGMGEPLLNYSEVIKFLNILTEPKGFAFATRRVTVSTAGIIPMMERLGKETKTNLAVSLNAAEDSLRSYLMPVNKKYPLRGLLDDCRAYPLQKNRRITFEYVLIKGINDSSSDAKMLIELLQGIPCKINLIPFNPFHDSCFERPADAVVSKFQEILLNSRYTAFIRQSKGRDISAACGQLKGRIHPAS